MLYQVVMTFGRPPQLELTVAASSSAAAKLVAQSEAAAAGFGTVKRFAVTEVK